RGDAIAARGFFRAALALDPSFAHAYLDLATTFSNRNMADSARWALDQAQIHGERLSEVQRLDAAGRRAILDLDLSTALAAYERALTLDPSPGHRAFLENYRAYILSTAGRLEEALVAYEAASRMSPVEPNESAVFNKAYMLLVLGRLPEARSELPRLRGQILYARILLVLSLLEHAWDRADSVATAMGANPTLASLDRSYFLFPRADLMVRRGQWTRAGEEYATAGRLFREEGTSRAANLLPWSELVLADLRGRPGRAVEPSPDRVMLLFFTSFEGDSARVRAGARTLAAEFHPDVRPEFLAGIEGFLAFREQRWAEAIRDLSPPARGSWMGGAHYERMRNRARWAVATAFERTGRPDSAAVYLGLILRPKQWALLTIYERSIYEPFVRRRLLRLALAQGRTDEARAQWDELLRAMTQPDAEARRFLDETSDALALAGGM
ncbi:MAG: hypothetical protein ABIP29_00515, partial [Candidatus Eisenbacteria bacterium]